MEKSVRKPYVTPRVGELGSVESITGWSGKGAGEFLGGSSTHKISGGSRGAGPADFGS